MKMFRRSPQQYEQAVFNLGRTLAKLKLAESTFCFFNNASVSVATRGSVLSIYAYNYGYGC